MKYRVLIPFYFNRFNGGQMVKADRDTVIDMSDEEFALHGDFVEALSRTESRTAEAVEPQPVMFASAQVATPDQLAARLEAQEAQVVAERDQGRQALTRARQDQE